MDDFDRSGIYQYRFVGSPAVVPVLEKKGHERKPLLSGYLIEGPFLPQEHPGRSPSSTEKSTEQREVEGQVRAAQRANERAQSYLRGEVADANGNRISVMQVIDKASQQAVDGACGGTYAPPIRAADSVGGAALASLVATNAKAKTASMLGPRGPVSVHGAVPTHTDLRAIGPHDRFDGMMVLVAGHTLWRYSASSTDLSSSVKVPMDEPATGRWLIVRDDAEARPRIATTQPAPDRSAARRTAIDARGQEALRLLGEAFRFFDGEQVMRLVQRRQIEAILAEDARLFPTFARARRATVFAKIETHDTEPQEAAAVAHVNVPDPKGLGCTLGGVKIDRDDMLVFLAAQTTASQNGLWKARRGAWERPCAWLDRLNREIGEARHMLTYLHDYEQYRGGGTRPSNQSTGYAEVLIGDLVRVYERARSL